METMTRDQMLDRFFARDRRYDGHFITGVLTTGIYCLPSCGARKPRPENVRFFGSEDEARAGGLRPCRRCRPDHFYRAYDPDLHLVETLAADVRRDPARFADAAAMVAASGVGTTKVHSLFRRHFHQSPAAFLAREKTEAAARALTGGAAPTEAAYAAGFASASAFHAAVRRHTGLTPGEHRRLGSSPGFVLSLPPGYLASYTLARLGRDAESPVERVAGSEIAKALLLAGGPAVLRIALGDGVARCRVEAGRTLAPEEVRAAHAVALRLLGLGSDPAAFERRVDARPELARVVEGRRGLRVVLTSDPWEALVWAIVGQQVNLAFAFALRRDLVHLAGTPIEGGLVAHPTPEAVARLDAADLAPLRFSRRKAEYVVDTARAVASGELPLDALAAGTATEADRRLRAVRGIGPWTAQYVLMRGLGFADCVPVGDAGLVAALARFFALDLRPNPEETVRLMEPFAPFRSLATHHLWATLGDAA